MTYANPISTSRRALLALSAAAWLPPAARAQAASWPALLDAARGQTVRFNAWAGSQRINAYLQWVAQEVKSSFGVTLEHVKVADTVDVVKRVRADQQAGKLSAGLVDLVWINGENFAAMKKGGLLLRFADRLPNFGLVDVQGKPSTTLDFSIPTEGLESPWGMAQLTFMADARRLPKPPQSMAELLQLARAQPGRLTYPRPPDFHGTTFIKQALLESLAAPQALRQPYAPEAFAATTAPLWAYLDQLHPHLWRAGRQFPQNQAAMRQMMADGELLLSFTFNPNEAANEIAGRRLPDSVVSWQFKGGTIGNTHFVAIPFNAAAKEGAQVVANFLLSPAAQARKADIAQWGDPTVLDMAKLAASERALFGARPAPGQVDNSAPVLPEPHASWVDPLEREWLRRHGGG